jgi:hypothetical protein
LQSAQCELKLALGLFLLRDVQSMADNVGWIAIFLNRQVPIQPHPHFSVPSYDAHETGNLSDGDGALRPAYARIPNLILLDMLPKLSGQRFSILIGLFPTVYAFVAPAAERPDGLRSKSPGAGRTVEW